MLIPRPRHGPVARRARRAADVLRRQRLGGEGGGVTASGRPARGSAVARAFPVRVRRGLVRACRRELLMLGYGAAREAVQPLLRGRAAPPLSLVVPSGAAAVRP